MTTNAAIIQQVADLNSTLAKVHSEVSALKAQGTISADVLAGLQEAKQRADAVDQLIEDLPTDTGNGDGTGTGNGTGDGTGDVGEGQDQRNTGAV